jgi:hypothetical protein
MLVNFFKEMGIQTLIDVSEQLGVEDTFFMSVQHIHGQEINTKVLMGTGRPNENKLMICINQRISEIVLKKYCLQSAASVLETVAFVLITDHFIWLFFIFLLYLETMSCQDKKQTNKIIISSRY